MTVTCDDMRDGPVADAFPGWNEPLAVVTETGGSLVERVD